jgi:DNA-binding NarL/FixJ family response regulator
VTTQRSTVLIRAPRLIRDCLATALRHHPQLAFVDDAEGAADLLEELRVLAPDIVVLDPDAAGITADLIAEVLREDPQQHIVVLTRNNVGAAPELMRAGVQGYLDYNCSLQDLIRCLERVNTGDMVVMAGRPPGTSDDEDRGPLGTEYERLTQREQEVLQLVAEGRTNADIANELSITNHTVKGHLGHILAKLMLHNRVQLAVYAARLGAESDSPP